MYNAAPIAFFGPGYSLSSSELKFNTITHAGGAIGTFAVVAGTDVITTTPAHNLKVGDTVKVSTTTTLPAGLAAATAYYVKTVPSSTTLTLSATNGGAVIDITDSGTGTHTMVGTGLLAEVTDAEAHADTGDFRKVCFGLAEMIHKKWNLTPSADRPAKMTVSRSSSVDENTGQITKYYTFSFVTEAGSIEVVGE